MDTMMDKLVTDSPQFYEIEASTLGISIINIV